MYCEQLISDELIEYINHIVMVQYKIYHYVTKVTIIVSYYYTRYGYYVITYKYYISILLTYYKLNNKEQYPSIKVTLNSITM